MALSDLELLQLAETAKEKSKGPKGDPGVSIEKIEQFDDDSFTIFLSNGYSKKIDLPTAKDGGVGPAGIQGQRGEPGPAGRAGRDGKSGLDGANGLPGAAGISVDTGVVNSNGHLLLGLTDGSVIDVGRVVGPPGATGERGATGLVGAAGRDGEAVLSGPRAPTQDDGKDGDHWIDLSSATFGFYKKSSGTWIKLGELKVSQLGQQQTAAGGGGGSGGGGVDLPPVIIDKDPPVKGNNKGPIRPGDLWFDSDQLALYVATKDSSNNIVWVICIPGVTGVPGTQTASVPVVYPKAVDGEEWVNPLTQVTYRYNQPKKQWINVNGGIVSVQDKAPLTPQTGSLWFDTEDDELTLYIYEGDAWVPAAPPVSLDGINATIDAALVVQEDLKARIGAGESKQKALESKVAALEGTVVDGVWKYGSRAWPQNRGEFDLTYGDNNKTTAWQDATTLRVHKQDIKGREHTFSEVSVADFVRIGQLGSNAVYKVLSEARPKEDYFEFLVEVVNYEGEAHEAILEYNFEFLPAFDATAYATKQYVDQAVAGIDIPAAGVQDTDRIIPKPSRWKYKKNETLAENLNRGEFLMKKDNNEVFKIYLSQYNEFGQKWGATSSEFDWSFNQRMIVSVTDYDGKIRYMAKVDKIAFNVGNNKYTRVEVSFPKMELEPLNDNRYLINVPGLLPTWRFEPFREYGTPT